MRITNCSGVAIIDKENLMNHKSILTFIGSTFIVLSFAFTDNVVAGDGYHHDHHHHHHSTVHTSDHSNHHTRHTIPHFDRFGYDQHGFNKEGYNRGGHYNSHYDRDNF